MYRKLHPVLLAVLVMTAVSCSKDDNKTSSKGKYDNGYFIINEGNFNHETGSVHFYSYAKDSLSEYAYDTENPGKTLGTNQQALEFATIFDNKLYLVVNYGGPLVVTDAYSLKESARLNSLPDAAQSHAFVGVDDNRGLISSDKGIYPLNLTTVTVGNKINGIDASVSDMVKAGNYIFVLTADKGIIALNSNDYSIAKTIGAATTGFAVGKDGDVWAATPNSLLKIHVSTLTVDTINTSFDIYYNPYVYTSGSIVASTKENAVYVEANQSAVYKYVVGNNTSLSAAFIKLPDNHYMYGKGLGYDPNKDELVLTTAESIYGGSVNTVYTYSASTGTASNSFVYNGYYYPAMVVFH